MPLKTCDARIGVDQLADYRLPFDQLGKRSARLIESPLPSLRRIDPREPHAVIDPVEIRAQRRNRLARAVALHLRATQRVAIYRDREKTGEDEGQSRPNWDFWIICPFWNITLALPMPNVPSSSHMNIWVR